MSEGLRVLVVDDESLARSRLRTLLSDCRSPAAVVAGEAGNATEAMEALRRDTFDALLLDVRMPGADGLALAFDLEAVDYLTKPVRLDRLQLALQKVERALATRRANAGDPEQTLVIQDRGRTERVPLSEVLYFKAEVK